MTSDGAMTVTTAFLAILAAVMVIYASMIGGTLVSSIDPNPAADNADSSPVVNSNDGTNAMDPPPGPIRGETNLSTATARFSGVSKGDDAGWSVTSVGDVNGDGKDDVLVGAPFAKTGPNRTETGAAYLFYGPVNRSNFNLSEANVTLRGEAPNSWAGFDVAGGDVNGDGKSDIVVGAPEVDNESGVAYVVYGSESLPKRLNLSQSDVRINGTTTGDLLGWSVATVNDTNRTPGDSVFVGAPLANIGAHDGGAAYLFSNRSLDGSVSANAANLTLRGRAANDETGGAVSSAGDVNGDNRTDLVVGAPTANGTAPNRNGTQAGAAYVVTNTTDGNRSLSNASLTLHGASAGDLAGFAVSDAGDVNGDGYGDVLVGAPHNDSNANNAGAAYVVYGSKSLSGNRSLADTNVSLYGAGTHDNAGRSVSAAGSGDTTCDGYSDVLVGAPYNNSSAPSAGAAYLVTGSKSLNGTENLSTARATLTGQSRDDFAGWSVSEAGDPTDDGNEDLLVGAPNASGHGAAYLIAGACPRKPGARPAPGPKPTNTKSSTANPGRPTTHATNAPSSGTPATPSRGPTSSTPSKTPGTMTPGTPVTPTTSTKTPTSTPSTTTSNPSNTSTATATTPGSPTTSTTTATTPSTTISTGTTTTSTATTTTPSTSTTTTTPSTTTTTPSGEQSIKFVNCSAVRVTGDFASVSYNTAWYEKGTGGGATSFDVEQNVSSGSTITAIQEGINGRNVIVSASGDVDGDGQADVTTQNPTKNQCLAKRRPLLIRTSVQSVESIGNGSYHVTFGYDNPNNQTFERPSSFSSGTTNNHPPTTFEPGRHSFTVTWTPQSPDERLTWSLDLRTWNYGIVNATASAPPSTTTPSTTATTSSTTSPSTTSGGGTTTATTATTTTATTTTATSGTTATTSTATPGGGTTQPTQPTQTTQSTTHATAPETQSNST